MRKYLARSIAFVLLLTLLTTTASFAVETEELLFEEEIPAQNLCGLLQEATEVPLPESILQRPALMTEDEKTLEEALVEGCRSRAEYVDVMKYNILLTELSERWYPIAMQFPEFLVSSSYQYVKKSAVIDGYTGNDIAFFLPVYLCDEQEFSSQQKLMEETVATYAASARQFSTPLEQLLFVHDKLAVDCTYCLDAADKATSGSLTQEDNIYFHAYGLFTKGTVVCQGYAQAFYMVAKELGFEVNYCYNNEHIWNYIKLDGKWYHMDVTWDDPTPDQAGLARHKYFLCADSSMSDHSPSQWKTPLAEFPVCDSTKYASGYIFNLPERKAIVKKDGYYQLGYDGYIFCSKSLKMEKVLATIPPDGVVRYIYSEEGVEPMNVYVAYKDENGILCGSGVFSRSGETAKVDNQYVFHGCVLPVAPKNATAASIYFCSAGAQKPMATSVSYSYPIDETEPVSVEHYAYVLDARVVTGNWDDEKVVQVKLLDMSGEVYEAELAPEVILGNFDQVLSSVIGYEGRNSFGHVKKNFLATVSSTASIINLTTFTNGLINRVIGYAGNTAGQVSTILVDGAKESGRDLALIGAAVTRYDAASQSFENGMKVNENAKVFCVASDDGTMSYARPTPLANLEKSNTTTIDSLVDGETYQILGFSPDETGAAKILVLMNEPME